MDISKKYRSTTILLIISIIMAAFNYIVIIKFQSDLLHRDITSNNNAIMNNAEDLSIDDISKLSYNDKLELARRYFAVNNLSKSEEIGLSILNNFPNDKDTINLLSAIYQIEMNYEKSIEYLESIMPVLKGVDLYELYDSLGDQYIIIDTDKSIYYYSQALKLRQNSNLNLENTQERYVEEKLNFIITANELKDDKDSFEFFKAVLNSDVIRDDLLKKYAFNEYKKLYESSYQEHYNELKTIYDNLFI